MANEKAFVEKLELDKAHLEEAGISDFLISESREGGGAHLLPNSRLLLLSIFGGFSDTFDPKLAQKV